MRCVVSDAVSEAEMEALPRMLTRLKLTAIRDRLDELLNEALIAALAGGS